MTRLEVNRAELRPGYLWLSHEGRGCVMGHYLNKIHGVSHEAMDGLSFVHDVSPRLPTSRVAAILNDGLFGSGFNEADRPQNEARMQAAMLTDLGVELVLTGEYRA